MGCVWESPVLLSLPVTRGRVAWGLEIRGRARTGLGPGPKLCWEIHHLPSSEREVTDWDRELFNSAIYSFHTLALYKLPHDHSSVTGGNISVVPGPKKSNFVVSNKAKHADVCLYRRLSCRDTRMFYNQFLVRTNRMQIYIHFFVKFYFTNCKFILHTIYSKHLKLKICFQFIVGTNCNWWCQQSQDISNKSHNR